MFPISAGKKGARRVLDGVPGYICGETEWLNGLILHDNLLKSNSIRNVLESYRIFFAELSPV